MFARNTLAIISLRPLLADPRDRRVARYALGSTIAMAVAMGFGWDLSFLVPVLSLSFFATPGVHPTLRGGISFVAIIFVACLAGTLLGRYLIPYPLVYIPFAGLVLFHVFYAQTGGTSPLLITWLLIALLVIPLLIMQGSGLAAFVASSIVLDAAVTIAVVLFVFWIIPEPAETPQGSASPAAAKPARTQEERFQSASLSTLVVLPVMILFYMFQWTGGLLILIFIAILSQQPGFAKNFQMGKALLVGNVIGGAAAIAFYELLVMVPEFYFLILLTLLAGLVFGARLFSGKPTGALYGMAFSTVLLVIGSTTTSTGDASAKVYTRVLQMMLAVGYVVGVFALIEQLRPRQEAQP